LILFNNNISKKIILSPIKENLIKISLLLDINHKLNYIKKYTFKKIIMFKAIKISKYAILKAPPS
jgi:hypothetical protein